MEIIRIGNKFVLTNVIISRRILSEYMNKKRISFKTFRYLKPQMKQIQTKIVSYTPQKYKTKERNPMLGNFAIFPVWFTVDSGEWSPERRSLEWCDWCDSWYVIPWAYLWNDPKHLLRYFIIDALFSWHIYFIEQVFHIRQTVKLICLS